MRKGTLISDLRSKFRRGYFLWATVFIIVGILLLYISTILTDKLWSSIFNQFSIALVISSFSGVIYELFLRKDFVRLIDENTSDIINEISLIRHKSSLGLIELRDRAGLYNYSKLLLESKNLVIVLNKGSSWYSVNGESLRKRFKDSNKTTDIFFLDPNNNQEALTVLSRKENIPVDSIKTDILNTVEKLKHIKTPDTKLTIYGHNLFNPYSLYLGDDYAIITPYLHTRRPWLLLQFEAKNPGCFYEELKDDIEELRNKSQEIFKQ
ncbi:MAG: hypothetical protein HC942_08335 [Microcoleus sp. SU_5_6]|nr:hypothetical protein [Microcoleus sp. SU_5_6]NJQ96625.1 hypothetical protein [Hydrococcus sp. CSU_1_8]